MSRITHDLCDWLGVPHHHPGGSRCEKAQTFRSEAPPAHPRNLVNSAGFPDPALPDSNIPVLDQSLLTSAPTRAGRQLILAGGSGFLGKLLARHFIARGWGVMVFTRQPRGKRAGVREVYWDGEHLGKWVRALEGADAVINLAGRSVNCRYHARNRRLMLDSRVNATRVLGEAIARCGRPPRVWLNFSTATIYKHTFGPAWDEAGEIGATPEAKDAFSIEVATAWERAFNEAVTPRTRKVVLRSAMVFGLSDDANNVFRVLRRLVRCGLGGRMGNGRQFVSWIHETDFCRAVEFLIDREDLHGPVNLAAPHPLTNADMMAVLRRVSKRAVGLPAAEWMLELGAFFLRTETELIIKSRRVIAGRLRKAGFQFQFEQLEASVRDLESRLANRV